MPRPWASPRSRAVSNLTAAMSDNYPVQWTGRLAILALPERVGDSNAGQIREELLRVINFGATELVIDMTGTASCDHEGAAAVARAQRRATASGTQLRLAVTAEAVRWVLSLNGLDRLIPVYPSLGAAIAAVAPAATVPVTLQPGGRHAAQPRKPAGYAGSSAEATGLGAGR
jgi:anti-sigma B factor antagonist